MKLTRAFVYPAKNGYIVSVLVRIGHDCWKESLRYKQRCFQNKDAALMYARTFGETIDAE